MRFAFSSHRTMENHAMAAEYRASPYRVPDSVIWEQLFAILTGSWTGGRGKATLSSPQLSFPTIDTGYLDVNVISPKVKFTVAPSLEGGIDIEIGSVTIHVPKYFSVQHPVCQMVLLADEYGDKFYYPKRLAPQRIVHMFEKSHSSASQNVYEAGWVAAKPESQPHNHAGTGSELGRAEICGGSNEPSLPVLIDMYTASEEQRADDHGFVLDSGACERSNTNGDRQTDSTITMHGQPFVDNPGDEHRNNPQSSGAPLITPSAETTAVPMVHELGESELEYHSDLVAEPVIVKTEEANASATWIVATAAPHHATGNRDLLSSFAHQHSAELFVHAADGTPMKVLGCGNVVTDAVVLPDVWYIPGLPANLVSISQLAELDYGVGFSRAECYIRSPDDGGLVGSARVGDEGLFQIDFLKVPLRM